MPNIKELQEQRKAAMDELAQADTREAIEAAHQSIKSIDEQIETMEAKKALIESLGATGGIVTVEEKGSEPAAKTIGEHFARFAKGKMPKGRNFHVSAPAFDAKSAAPMTKPTYYADALANIKPEVVEGYRAATVIGDLFNVEPITNGDSVTWWSESTTIEGGFAAVAEGGSKPMISFGDPVEHKSVLTKIAGHYKVSDEVLDDAPRLAEAINRRALYQHDITEATQLLSGNGSSANMTGLLATSGIQTKYYTHGGSMSFDTILEALGAVSTATGLTADAILMAPADYYALLGSKDANYQYYVGGPVYGPYGNGTIQSQPTFWGVPVYTTPLLTAGTAVVGAFKQGGTVYRKGGVTVSVFNQNEDDAIKNLVTIVVESRCILAVERPAAFVKVVENPT